MTAVRRAVRAAAWLLAVAIAGAAAIRVAGLDRGYPLVPAMAFLPYATGASVVLVALLAVARRRGPALLAAAGTAALIAVMVPRALDDGDHGDDAPRAGEGTTVTVMTANALVGHADAAAIVRIVRRQRVDVLSIPELTPELVERLEQEGIADELPHRVLDAIPDSAGGTGLFTRAPITRVGPAGRTAMTVAAGRVGGTPVEFISSHPIPPRVPHWIRSWTRSLHALPSAGRGPVRIIAGDLNATLDHHELRAVLARGYTDAAEDVGEGFAGTWPRGRRWPPPLVIDHVLVDERAVAEAVEVFDVRVSDHRAVVARVRVP